MTTGRGPLVFVDESKMPPATKLDVQWSGPTDDKTGRCGEYMLRYEQMGDDCWWCAVTHQDRVVYDSTIEGDDAVSANAAYMRVMVAMADHLAGYRTH